jgi:5-methylcytosine-specific restriction enzyme subunit McrC
LTKLVQRGIKSDYIDREENLAFLKGKLKFAEHIKYNFVHKERFYVQYQEFMSDRIENRLIKTTLDFLYKKSKNSTNQQRIREFQFVFDEIQQSNDPKNDFEKVRLNRQMKDYEQVLLWCKTFLLGNSFSPYQGNDIAFALLFDMNLLFESYVGYWLKKNQADWLISLQDKRHHLAYIDNGQGKVQLKPDIVMTQDTDIIIADTKWKVLDQDKTHQGVAQGDMYQLFAYGKKYTECKKMYLIYPKSSNTIDEKWYQFHQNNNPDLSLQIVLFDLEKPEDFLLMTKADYLQEQNA